MPLVGSHESTIAAICVISGVLLYLAEGSSNGDEGAGMCPHGAAIASEKGREAAAALCPYMASKRAANVVATNRWFFCAVTIAAVAAGAFYFKKWKL